jgi:hypothetical protein
MFRSLPLLVVIGLFMSAASQGEVYRWVNEEGVTVYSQLPPPGGTTDVVKPPPPAPAGAKTLPPVYEQLKALEDRKSERQAREKRQAELQQWHAKRRANCETARRNLEILQGPTRRLISTQGTDYQRLSEERRQEMITEAKDQIEEFCTGRAP